MPVLYKLHAGVSHVFLQQRRRSHRSDRRPRAARAIVGVVLYDRTLIHEFRRGSQNDGFAIPPMAHAQVGDLDRSIRHVGLCWLWSLHHVVSRRNRLDGRSGGDSGGRIVTTTQANSTSINPWTAHAVRITGIKQEIPDTSTYEMVFDDADFGANFRFQPGQFNMLYLPGFGESAISISSDPDRSDSLAHTVRIAGNVTQALARHRVGDQILLRGPFGSAWPIDESAGQDVVIACGGIGLAPLRPAIYHIINHRDDYRSVYLLYGARSPDVLLYTDEFHRWRDGGIEMETTVDSGNADWHGHIGVVPNLFDRLDLDAGQTRVLTCGPEIMMRFVVFAALSRSIEPQHIYVSMERNMQCAVGFCGHCQLGPEFVCKDGPVFTYERMEPYLNLEDL